MKVAPTTRRIPATTIAIVGWLGAVVAPAVMLWVTSHALLERRSGSCAGDEQDHVRDWVFTVLPLGQTCDGQITPGQLAVQLGQTAVVVVAGVTALICLIWLITRGARTDLPSVARWLLVSTLTGAVLGSAALLRATLIDQPTMFPGAWLSATWQATLAFCVGLAAAGIVGLLRSMTVLSRSE